MRDTKWDMSNLKRLLIAHQQEYTRKGIDHGLFPESDTAFYSTWINHRMIVLSLIPEECRRPGTNVIDLGGGKGRISVLLSELGLDCTIIDCMYEDKQILNPLGQPYIPLLVSYLKNKGVCVISHDFYEKGIPLPDEKFKLVIFSEVIEHLPNSPKPVLSEIQRVLVPGGWLILTTPNLVSINKRINFLRGYSYRENIEVFYKMEAYPLGSVYRGHNREYTRKEVEYMLGQENFTIAKSMTCDYHNPDRSYMGIKRLILNGIKSLSKKLSPDMRDFTVILARR